MRLGSSLSLALILASTEFVICYRSNNLQGDSKYWTKIPKIDTNLVGHTIFLCFTIFWDFNLMVSQNSCTSSWMKQYPTGSWVWGPGVSGDPVTTIIIISPHNTNNTEQTGEEMMTWTHQSRSSAETMMWMIWKKSHLCPTIPIMSMSPIPPSVSITTIISATIFP